MAKQESAVQPRGSIVAIYHRVYAHETFEQTVPKLVKLVQSAQHQQPDKPRHLYLDIDGHKLPDGAWDRDMWELQYHFIMEGGFHRFFSEINVPVGSFRCKEPQINEIPDEINVFDPDKGEQPPGDKPLLNQITKDRQDGQ
jgi:hypothetical protein